MAYIHAIKFSSHYVHESMTIEKCMRFSLSRAVLMISFCVLSTSDHVYKILPGPAITYKLLRLTHRPMYTLSHYCS